MRLDANDPAAHDSPDFYYLRVRDKNTGEEVNFTTYIDEEAGFIKRLRTSPGGLPMLDPDGDEFLVDTIYGAFELYDTRTGEAYVQKT